MTNLSKFTTAFTLLMLLTACQNKSNPSNEAIQLPPDKVPQVANKQCFLHALNQDTTFVSLTIDGTKVTGDMNWQPYEKDGAIGTLSGTKTPAGELDLNYAYTIEGSNQTEAKIMKIEGNKLYIKNGELIDPGNDGNLKYKDITKAVYSEVLEMVECK
jgi:hypothetical protein